MIWLVVLDENLRLVQVVCRYIRFQGKMHVVSKTAIQRRQKVVWSRVVIQREVVASTLKLEAILYSESGYVL